ncbi:FAD-binding and (Fe-S)-binding domain-containing protein [Halarchaeum nitratireducens]|uniref:D-lactate dehydrogenase (cytochrome) n=1 Tax=Halarchaeum nitratireducens TaxID=489913 RepID=A0A830G9J6_9EURY|nr:FAD-binding and (Fe-S)-binding domain-containing protein [Halarchaeum nitratireducens]GGN10541.1 FAD-dependent oxidoreductase [Halarchaeum nitratireducens]
MTTRQTDAAPPDPATASDADYDYAGEDVERPDLLDALDRRADGEVRFDSYSRELYATDASPYEVTPIGVVFPRNTADVAAVVEYCAAEDVPVLPRGGGTSLAGQTVNEAVVLDFTRHMDGAADADPEARTVRVQPGITLARLNDGLSVYDLKFAPDPAAGDRSVIGGAIGNNSTGSHSLKYGKTDAYVEEVEAVLADGSVTRFGEVSIGEIRERADAEGDIEGRIHAAVLDVLETERAEIDARYPELKRNVSGYNFDMLVDEAYEGARAAADADAGADAADEGDALPDDATVNLARLLAGSEGTLAIVTEATVSLEPIPETKAVALLTYDELTAAVEDVTEVLEHDPAAVEFIDDTLIDLAGDTSEFHDVVEMLPEGTRAALLVEFYAESDDEGREKVDALVADRVGTAAMDAIEAHGEDERGRVWKLRKAGNPILLSRTTDEKHLSFIEDCAVPADVLPEYVAGFREILADHDTFGAFYGHAGPGVLHIRPLITTKTEEGLAAYESIADEVTDLVVELGGSVSGEHGDGRARTQWNEKLYGRELWETFRELKTAYDPDWLLNPGQVCGYDPDETLPEGVPKRARRVSMTEDLRYDPDYEFDADFEPELVWENDNGFEGMVELCHGCGGCRTDQDTAGGVMCPTYRASDEEIQATRGRANLLRQAMSGDLPDEQFDVEFMHEVMDLCIGCKGCSNDCPSEVDMAKMKAEVTHEYHQREGASLRDRIFANVDTLSKLGSMAAPLSNLAAKIPGSRALLERTLGITSERSLPSFRAQTLHDWFEARGGSRVSKAEAKRRVVFFVDTYTNYSHPAVGKAAIEVLEAAGVHVDLAERTDSGRPAHSKGFLDKSRATASENVAELHPRVEDGWDVVLVEPSDAVMVQHDYRDLLSGERVEAVAENTYGVMEYLDAHRLVEELDTRDPAETLTYHGHCHQKAVKKDHHAVGALRRAGYEVDPLDSGCCGMAGSFGYEAEHTSMSDAIGDVLFEQVAESDGDRVVAPGASCRTQLGDRDEDAERPPTPIEMLATAVRTA